MPHEPQTPTGVLDAAAVRAWTSLVSAGLGRARADLDAINVYPIADADTGTNLALTADSGAAAVADLWRTADTDPAAPHPTLDATVRAYARGALLGARGNSGTILAQLLRGVADGLTAPTAEGPDGDPGPDLARALGDAADAAYRAVAHPVEGTMLTVARAAADAARELPADAGPLPRARAAHDAARTALARTPDQLAALGRAGVVDAGGCGLVTVLDALCQALSGERHDPEPVPGPAVPVVPQPGTPCERQLDGPRFEVVYLLDAEEPAVDTLRTRLDRLGDSLVVVGGDGLWNVHVHVDDPGAAVEAGVEAGRPHRIRVTHFGDAHDRARTRATRTGRTVVAVLPGEGLAELCAAADAHPVPAHPDTPPSAAELAAALTATGAAEVVLLTGLPELRPAAALAAEEARADGIRVAVIPTRSPVQSLAALAVHDPAGGFDEDVIAMTAAAGATRHGELTVAAARSFTSAGICQAGDVLGLIDGDVAVIGTDLADTAVTVLDRMLGPGGELVTLVLGEDAPEDLAARLEGHVRARHLAVDTVTYRGGRHSAPLLIGVE
ncbi:DAK2 domain-containing protein [Streptomyces sp. BI20]|uniref:DAK2 domain-containing protein n=1 Tax=Streptomyces sp. BI20 TaxID=3403460 RepID=UPI003C7340C6